MPIESVQTFLLEEGTQLPLPTPTPLQTVTDTVWDGITSCLGVITANPLLLIPIVIGFVGVVIGITKGFIGFGRRKGR